MNHCQIRTALGGAALAAAVAVGLSSFSSISAQQAPPAPQQPPAAQAIAPIDLTGTWVSVVTEEWRWRMVTPPKGDVDTIPLNDAARQVVNQWDPARDTAAGNACIAYGAVGIMRIPARFRVSWQDANTLKMEVDAGQQTRLFRFGNNLQRPSTNTEWQGFSAAYFERPGGGNVTAPNPAGGGFGGGGAGGGGVGGFGQVANAPPVAAPGGAAVAPGGAGGRGGRAAGAGAPAPAPARGGSLTVTTTNLKSGYIRKNGIPYSDNAEMTERFFVNTTPDGNQWLTVTQYVRDPQYLNAEYVTSWHYKKEPNDAKWRPTPCIAS